MKGFPLEPELIPIPIVLNIRLDEDCMYKVDEDYVQFLGRTLDKEKKISGRRKGKNKLDNVVCWDKFGSAAILKDGGIPPDWIVSIKCPHVPTPLEAENVFEFLSLDPAGASNGHWQKVPKELSKETPFGYSMQMIIDDMFKLAYAYDLSGQCQPLQKHAYDISGQRQPSLQNMSLGEAFESMMKHEFLDGSNAPYNTVYTTPSYLLAHGTGIPPWSIVAAELRSFDGKDLVATNIVTLASSSTNIGTSLTGAPSDWDILDPKAPGLRWFKGAPEDYTATEKHANLKAGYAIILFHCAHYLIESTGGQGRPLPL
jgi:hypothetical protein